MCLQHFVRPAHHHLVTTIPCRSQWALSKSHSRLIGVRTRCFRWLPSGHPMPTIGAKCAQLGAEPRMSRRSLRIFLAHGCMTVHLEERPSLRTLLTKGHPNRRVRTLRTLSGPIQLAERTDSTTKKTHASAMPELCFENPRRRMTRHRGNLPC